MKTFKCTYHRYVTGGQEFLVWALLLCMDNDLHEPHLWTPKEFEAHEIVLCSGRGPHMAVWRSPVTVEVEVTVAA